jgi:uncharacterized protein YciI
MLFMVAGYLRADAEPRLIDFRNEFNEHWAQPFRTLAAAGALRDRDGKRAGYMAFLEADSIAEAERYLGESPFYREDLYERVDIFEYRVEIGAVG